MTSVKGLSTLIEPFDGRGDFNLWQQWVKKVCARGKGQLRP